MMAVLVLEKTSPERGSISALTEILRISLAVISGLATILYALLPRWYGKELPLCMDAPIHGAGLAPREMENMMKILQISTLAIVFWTLSVGVVADPGKPRDFQASPVMNGTSGEEDGAAWLKRSKDRVDG
jgi:hypothetical protein